MAGDATARLIPFPSVTFENVRVGDPDKPLVVAKRFSMDAELAPFLSGEILIFDMRLENPTITLDLDERGLPDWPLPADSPVSPAQVTLENARISNATVVLDDRVAGRTWRMEGLDATVSAESLYGPFRISGTGTLNGTPLGFRVNTGALSKTGFSLRTVVDLPDPDIELAVDGRVSEPEAAGGAPYNGTFTVRPREATPETRYTVEGGFAASPRSFEVAEYRAEFGAAEDPYVVTGSAGISGGRDPSYHVTIKGTQVTLAEEAAAGQESISGSAKTSFPERLATLQGALARLPLPPLPGSIDVDLPAIVAGDTTIRDIRLAASPDAANGTGARRRWKVSGFSAQLPGRTTVEADGTLQLPLAGDADSQASFTGNLLVASRQPSGLAAWLTGSADEPIRRLANAGFAAKVELTPERQSIDDLEVILGPARMNGSVVRVSDPDRRPTLDVKLSGDAIDFATLEAAAAVFVGEGGVSRFSGHDLDVALDLSNPDIAGVKLERLETSIRSRGERTEIDRLSAAGLYGASVSATASLDRKADGTHTDVDATVVAGDGARLIRGLAARFPDIETLQTLSRIAARNGAAFSDTRLDIVGSAELDAGLAGEASLSVSGETGGTDLSVTSTARGEAGKPEEAKWFVNASLDNETGERILQQAGLDTFSIESAGPLSVEARFDGSLFDGMRTRLTLEGDTTTARLEGVATSDVLSTGFAGTAQVESSDIEPWLMALGYGLPGMGLGTTTEFSTALSWRSGKAVLHDITLVANGSKATGELTVDASGEVPTVRGRMDFEYLDAGQLYAIVTGDAASAMLAGEGEAALKREFGAPVLADNDIEIALKADEAALPAGNAVLTEVSGSFTYRDNAMGLSGLKARFGNGTLAGMIDMQNNGGMAIVNAQLSGDDIDVAALLPAVAPAVTGTTDFALQTTGSGRSAAALLASLKGSGVLSTGPLSVRGLNADGFDAMIRQADAIGYEIKPEQIRALAETAFLSGRTDLPAADYPLAVTGGVVRIANATARAGALSMTTDASVSLATGAISGRARLTYDPGDEAVAGPQPEIALDFRSKPDGGFAVETDYSPVTGYLTQRALEKEQARVEALQARLLEKQRLRREVQLYAYRKRTRMQMLEEERLRRLEQRRIERENEEARQRDAAAEEAARRLAGSAGERPDEVGAAAGQAPAGESLPAGQAIDLERLDQFLPQPVGREPLVPVRP
ncbi:MAG: AsmA family protein [Oricola sp.]